MIPASVQAPADATAPLGEYAFYALLFVGGCIIFCWLCLAVPRWVRQWRDAKHVVNTATAFCREADRQAQR